MTSAPAKTTIEKSKSFCLQSWLKDQIGDYALDIPLLDVSNKQADEQREWLITNGLGSYASGNLWGANSRRYHGLGIFALEPPVRRTVLLSHIDEVADGEELSTNFWTSGAITPEGYKNVGAFTIYPVPTWAFDLPKGKLIKQVGMLHRQQDVYIGYTWEGKEPLDLTLQVSCNCRDFHSETMGSSDWRFQQELGSRHVTIKAYDSAPELIIAYSGGTYVREPDWYWSYYWPREHERGLGFREDCFHVGKLSARLQPGESLTIRAGLNRNACAGSIRDVVRNVVARHNQLVVQAGSPKSQDARRLIIAADQFIVKRHSTSSDSIIAGYHWFADWGRDSMISLPGLTLSTGQTSIAAGILQTFGHYLSEGMLPNNFPDSGSTPQYNTIDATLWWAWALQKYFAKTQDAPFIRSQLPLLDQVVDLHVKGTRYGIHVDPEDGLVCGGQPNVQLTWMDAKVGDYVVTPRVGKPVEINALWFNFLKTLEQLHNCTGSDGSKYGAMADHAKTGFQKFWNESLGCLYDVISPDGTRDSSIRPNQLLAVSLPYRTVSDEQAKSILKVIDAELLTNVGLRTLSARHPDYKGGYGGGNAIANQYERDITYHQGTVWPWLLGPWVDARFNVFGDTPGTREYVLSHLAPIKRHVLGEAGLGSISEIFDGDKPYNPRGCIAQAWSVAELLRVLIDYNL